MKFSLSLSLSLSLLLSLALSSCTKDLAAPDNEVAQAIESASSQSATFERFYLNEEVVDPYTMSDTSKWYQGVDEVVGSDTILALHAFTTLEGWLTFADSYGIPVRSALKKAALCRHFADSIGAIAHYEETGEIMEEYSAYQQQIFGSNKPSTGVSYIVHWEGYLIEDHGRELTQLISGGYPILPSFNNIISGFRPHTIISPGVGIMYYDKTFFRPLIPMFSNWSWATWSGHPGVSLQGYLADNKASSSICY